jgi:hypothetical protein
MFQIRDGPATQSVALSADYAPSSSPKKMTSFPDENISSINRTSDFNGFEGLRVVVWQGVKNEDLSTGRKTLPYFMMSYRPGEESRSTVAESQGGSAMIPPERPFEAIYADARGRSASFRIESGFLADVVRRAGLDSVKLEQASHGRFLMDLRLDQLCLLLMRETERQAPLAPLYFESLATALIIAVVTQADATLAEAGSLYVRDERIKKDLRIRVISVGFFGAPSARRPDNTNISKSTNRPKDRTYVLDGPRSIDSTRHPPLFITMTTYLSCCSPSANALFRRVPFATTRFP